MYFRGWFAVVAGLLCFAGLVFNIAYRVGNSSKDKEWTKKVIEKGVMEWQINPKTGEKKLEWTQ